MALKLKILYNWQISHSILFSSKFCTVTPFILSLSSYIYLYSGAITLQYARPIINLKSSLVVNSSSGTETDSYVVG